MHASVGLADVWTVLERGLLLDRLKRAHEAETTPRPVKEGFGAGIRGWRDIFAFADLNAHLLLAAHPQLTSSSSNTF